MAGLQEALNETYESKSINTCSRCKDSNIIESLLEGNHIIFDVEDIGNSLLADRHAYSNCKRQFTIEEIPDKLVYGKHTYKFVSAIIYSYINEHYYAFIKRLTGKWEKHNDLQNRVMAASTRTLLQKYHIHILCYIKILKTELVSE